MNIKITKASLYFLIILLSTSCVSPQKIAYFQNKENSAIKDSLQNYKIKIMPGDLLSINVSTLDMEVAAPFNLYESVGSGVAKPISYLVNTAGVINFPIIGKLKVGGFTTDEVTENLAKLLTKYLKNPIVNLRIKNFKITVLGEVQRPGSYPVNGERISIFDAIGMAGDLTIQGRRSNLTLLREEKGTKKYISLDLTDKNIAYSPYFYLRQNDVLYVEPNKTKINSSAVGPNISIFLAAFSTIISTLAILKIIR